MKTNHICKLNKAIYGLKQAPKPWYTRLSNLLISNNFKTRMADSSLFVYKPTNVLIWVLV